MRDQFETYDNELASMRRMVRKLYPDFHEDRNYCLWLIFDYFEEAFSRNPVSAFPNRKKQDNRICPAFFIVLSLLRQKALPGPLQSAATGFPAGDLPPRSDGAAFFPQKAERKLADLQRTDPDSGSGSCTGNSTAPEGPYLSPEHLSGSRLHPVSHR